MRDRNSRLRAAAVIMFAGAVAFAGRTVRLESAGSEKLAEATQQAEDKSIGADGKKDVIEKGNQKDRGSGKRELEGKNRTKEILTRFPKQKQLVFETERGCCEAVPAKNGSMEILVSAEFIKQALRIGVLEFPDGKILLQQGSTCIRLQKGSREMISGTKIHILKNAPYGKEEVLYLPLEAICEAFGYKTELDLGSWRVRLEQEEPYRNRGLPKIYDYRKVGRSTRVRDQGGYGTCWSFASLTSLETALLPQVSKEFSADHMSLHNAFSLDQKEGGEYTMSMAYLLAWQGPVLEEEDPYGDGFSPDGLKPAVHIQEIQVLPKKDYKAIKEAVFFHGGVQSSLYTSLSSSSSQSDYYNREKNAYCYQGDLNPNHDVVIVGWDDYYPKENFRIETEGDGAFLCVSSWGENFGDQGYFYVSYYDGNIGKINVVYTGIEPADNYDHIYQSDLCGWVGQVGYGREKAFGANVFQTEEEEDLKAIGFYATAENTSYVLSLVHNVTEADSFQDRKVVAQGTVPYGGFYTIPVEFPERLRAGERFAVILEAKTPGAVHPIAVEYQADDVTKEADVTDGEGYISMNGKEWESVENSYQCNLCLKGYTTAVNKHNKYSGCQIRE